MRRTLARYACQVKASGLLALRRKDLNTEGTLAVRQTLQEDNETGTLSFAEPKSAKSRRRVDLPKIAIAALKAHRRKMLAEGNHGSLVFCDTDGKPIRKSNLIRRSSKKIIEQAQLPEVVLENLPHDPPGRARRDAPIHGSHGDLSAPLRPLCDPPRSAQGPARERHRAPHGGLGSASSCARHSRSM